VTALIITVAGSANADATLRTRNSRIRTCLIYNASLLGLLQLLDHSLINKKITMAAE